MLQYTSRTHLTHVAARERAPTLLVLPGILLGQFGFATTLALGSAALFSGVVHPAALAAATGALVGGLALFGRATVSITCQELATAPWASDGSHDRL